MNSALKKCNTPTGSKMPHSSPTNTSTHTQTSPRTTSSKTSSTSPTNIIPTPKRITMPSKRNAQKSTPKTTETGKEECSNICANKSTSSRSKTNSFAHKNIVGGAKNHSHTPFSSQNRKIPPSNTKKTHPTTPRKSPYKWRWNFKNPHFLPPKKKKEEVKYGSHSASSCSSSESLSTVSTAINERSKKYK